MNSLPVSRMFVAPHFLSALCGAMFVASLLLDGIIEERGSWNGLMVLLVGWLGPLNGIFAWYANPLLIFALLYARQRAALSRILAICGFLIGSSAMLAGSIPYDDGYSQVLRFGPGYYLWLACFPVAFLASLYPATRKPG